MTIVRVIDVMQRDSEVVRYRKVRDTRYCGVGLMSDCICERCPHETKYECDAGDCDCCGRYEHLGGRESEPFRLEAVSFC